MELKIAKKWVKKTNLQPKVESLNNFINKDYGNGIKMNSKKSRTETIGLSLMATLAEELAATIKIENGNRIRFTLVFTKLARTTLM